MSLLSNTFKLGTITLDKNYCMTAEEMKNMDASLYPKVFPIWCTTDNCLYIMYKQNDGSVRTENLKEMDWTDNPAVLYPVIDVTGKLTWQLKYLSSEEEIPEVNIFGKSAYEIWKDLGNEGTEEDFIEAIKGENGATGEKGEPGEAAIVQIGENGNWFVNNVDTGVAATGEKGDTGADGKSAYEIWKESDTANADATEEDFIASLKGEKGDTGADGKSAYDVWIEAGNEGTEDDFLESLRGVDGIDGQDGADGADGIDGQDGADGQDGIDGEDGIDGIDGKSAYDVWIEAGNEGTEDDFLESLRGVDGSDGTDGLDGKSAFEIWKEVNETEGTELTETDFLDSLVGEKGENGVDGQDGAPGKSAYEVWKEQEGNADKTVEEFLASLKGEDGADGINGKSAYEIWQDAGNTGTEADFLESLKGGPKGADGKSAFDVWKEQEGNTDKTEDDFIATLQGIDGKSAYGVWKEAGNTGTESDFLESLKGGPKGDAGVDGQDGVDGLDGKSAYEIWKESDSANAGKTEAEFLASLKGADGTNGQDGVDGLDGKSAYEIWKEQEGNSDKTEAEFIASLKGEDGLDGVAGKSAFEIWKELDESNSDKTESDFIDELKDKDFYEAWLNVGNEGTKADFYNDIISNKKFLTNFVGENVLEWEQGIEYDSGSCIIHNNVLYRCDGYDNIVMEPGQESPKDKTFEEQLNLKIFKRLTLSDLMTEIDDNKFITNIFIPQFSDSKSYKKYDIVKYNTIYYVYNSDTNSEIGAKPSTANNWVDIDNYGFWKSTLKFSNLREYIALVAGIQN